MALMLRAKAMPPKMVLTKWTLAQSAIILLIQESPFFLGSSPAINWLLIGIITSKVKGQRKNIQPPAAKKYKEPELALSKKYWATPPIPHKPAIFPCIDLARGKTCWKFSTFPIAVGRLALKNFKFTKLWILNFILFYLAGTSTVVTYWAAPYQTPDKAKRPTRRP